MDNDDLQMKGFIRECPNYGKCAAAVEMHLNIRLYNWTMGIRVHSSLTHSLTKFAIQLLTGATVQIHHRLFAFITMFSTATATLRICIIPIQCVRSFVIHSHPLKWPQGGQFLFGHTNSGTVNEAKNFCVADLLTTSFGCPPSLGELRNTMSDP